MNFPTQDNHVCFVVTVAEKYIVRQKQFGSESPPKNGSCKQDTKLLASKNNSCAWTFLH